MSCSGERALGRNILHFPPFAYLLADATGTGSTRFSGGLCSAAVPGAQLILLLPRCSWSCCIFSSSLFVPHCEDILLFLSKLDNSYHIVPSFHSDTQRKNGMKQAQTKFCFCSAESRASRISACVRWWQHSGCHEGSLPSSLSWYYRRCNDILCGDTLREAPDAPI